MMYLNYSIYTVKNSILNINEFLCTFNLTLSNVLILSAVVLLGFALIRNRWALFTSIYGAIVNVNSESNVITVIPDLSTRVISVSDSVEYKFEFNLSIEKIQEIIELLGTEITNNEITGRNADYIIFTYIKPLIESSEISSFFFEIFNHFGC